MKLTLLGTGNAAVTDCYNTCFLLEKAGEYLLVDGGGGNQLLTRLKTCGVDWKDVRHIFVTHKHIDHLLGIIWMLRMICQNMTRGNYDGEAWLYAHTELIDLLKQLALQLLGKKDAAHIDERFHFIPLEDGDTHTLLGHPTTFFDIGSTKAKQFGFSMEYAPGKKLTCCGDEPYNPIEEPYAKDSTWLLHEAFCLYGERDRFKPYEKHHSTVKDACELAEQLGAENLILYHTEDKNLADRKEKYTAEGKAYYKGNLYVPEDLESFEL